MHPPAIGIYAALLTGLYLLLAARVIGARRAARVALGTGGDAVIERRARVHANFAEYVPIAVLLLLLLEMAGYPRWVVHALAAPFLLARIAHAWGMSQANEDFRFRTGGMIVTFAVLAAAAALLAAAAVLNPASVGR